MNVEIDQSGKIGDTQVGTALAFSNHTSYSIYVTAVTKRKIIRSYKTTSNARVFYFRLFAMLLFLVLKDKVPQFTSICIDIEYAGWDGEIKGYLLQLFRRFQIPVDPAIIYFSRIGKKSAAHKVAIETFRSKKGNREVMSQEIADLFSPQKKTGALT